MIKIKAIIKKYLLILAQLIIKPPVDPLHGGLP
jgi:hypothetical protein